MRYIFILLIAVAAFQSNAQEADPNMGIIPQPVTVKKAKGEFKLTPVSLILSDATTERGVRFFVNYLKSAGYGNHLTDVHNIDKNPKSLSNSILLNTDFKTTLPYEGYEIFITEDRVIVNGKGAGLFYGVQTLIQLIEKTKDGHAVIPCGMIRDEPRFSYRGMHLDVARHFFDVAFIKKYIDALAAYKFNYFHWHLTDDQGWRIEIKQYPKLTSVGSKRAQTKVGSMTGGTEDLFDNTPYSGYYTQEEVKEIVDYAAERYINIIPEIEMPGHTLAALAAYPELSCDENKTYTVGETWGVSKDVLCPTETTFKMMSNILNEVIDLFPCKYVHIGGDECPKDVWKKSSFCQNLIRDLRLRDENELQNYFTTRIEKYLNARNRSLIGWDEILEGGLAPNATVMSWRGEAGGIAAAQLNHDVIMTPGSGGLYFDHAQSKSSQEPLSIGGYAPLWKTYSYNPVPDEINSEQQKHIIGVQANLWTEYIATPAKAEYMLLPRMLALSEVSWSPKTGKKDGANDKGYIDFSETRLPRHLKRLDAAGYNYRVPEPIGINDTVMQGGNFRFILKSPVEGAKVFYTIDGFTPRETDMFFTQPLRIRVPDGKKLELKTITITQSGKRSNVVRTVLDNGGN